MVHLQIHLVHSPHCLGETKAQRNADEVIYLSKATHNPKQPPGGEQGPNWRVGQVGCMCVCVYVLSFLLYCW